jgi:hypothetical protein
VDDGVRVSLPQRRLELADGRHLRRDMPHDRHPGLIACRDRADLRHAIGAIDRVLRGTHDQATCPGTAPPRNCYVCEPGIFDEPGAPEPVCAPGLPVPGCAPGPAPSEPGFDPTGELPLEPVCDPGDTGPLWEPAGADVGSTPPRGDTGLTFGRSIASSFTSSPFEESPCCLPTTPSSDNLVLRAIRPRLPLGANSAPCRRLRT